MIGSDSISVPCGRCLQAGCPRRLGCARPRRRTFTLCRFAWCASRASAAFGRPSDRREIPERRWDFRNLQSARGQAEGGPSPDRRHASDHVPDELRAPRSQLNLDEQAVAEPKEARRSPTLHPRKGGGPQPRESVGAIAIGPDALNREADVKGAKRASRWLNATRAGFPGQRCDDHQGGGPRADYFTCEPSSRAAGSTGT